MLLLGNSFVLFNDLDQAVAALFTDAGAPFETTVRLAEPGLTFAGHVEYASTDDTPWALAFADAHSWAVLQEQSQIPGFPADEPMRIESAEAALALDALVANTGARTMFLMTWGRLAGDESNAELYPDYPTMQDRLAEGYLAYAAEASADGTRAWVAPAGLAWRKVYEEVLAEGGDPLDPDGRFAALYEADGSHPSRLGTWLAACTIYAAITGESAEGAASLASVEGGDDLARVAYEVVHEDHGIAYPWGEDTPEDTGVDTGDIDTGGDTGGGPDDTGAPAADDAAEKTSEGCGCATGPSQGGGALLLGLALAAMRRPRVQGT